MKEQKHKKITENWFVKFMKIIQFALKLAIFRKISLECMLQMVILNASSRKFKDFGH